MHIVRSKFKGASGRVYETILLRESYREGKKVKKRTIANLKNCSPEEIAAIELALRHKNNLSSLETIDKLKINEGLSFGSVWVIFEMARRLGIVDALGKGREGQLAIWQVIARVLEQSSRLSAVRLAESYAIPAVIELADGFNEDDLYKNLFWLSGNQSKIEDKIFKKRSKQNKPSLFLYDVTSSYLEGQKNNCADWGYNRDKKKGKKQIVIGLLCDEKGIPVTTEVFKGNTQDPSTLASQIEKAKERFQCEKVTFVGDRGMIKSGQIAQLQENGFNYITAITRAQIKQLIVQGVIQEELFDQNLIDVTCEGMRYILRKNPVRAKEIAQSRAEKQSNVQRFVEIKNLYLKEHPRARIQTAVRFISEKLTRLKLDKYISVTVHERVLRLVVNEEALKEEEKLDGCYAIKTDLTQGEADAETIHDRYKDLAFVESSFKSFKSDLDIRPVYVRLEESTRGHVLVVMLAYMIIKELDKTWKSLYLTVAEGLRSLSTLCLLEVSLKDGSSFQRIPEPRNQNKQMLNALNIELPKILPKNEARVVTRKSRRKAAKKH